jgi:hypothetical protein
LHDSTQKSFELKLQLEDFEGSYFLWSFFEVGIRQLDVTITLPEDWLGQSPSFGWNL